MLDSSYEVDANEGLNYVNPTIITKVMILKLIKIIYLFFDRLILINTSTGVTKTKIVKLFLNRFLKNWYL